MMPRRHKTDNNFLLDSTNALMKSCRQLNVKINRLLSFVAIMLLGQSSYGDISIDNFGGSPQYFPPNSSSSIYVSDPGIVGTVRNASIYGPTVEMNFPTPGLVAFDNSFTYGSVFLVYAGTTVIPNGYLLNGLGDVDLTQGGLNNSFRFDITGANPQGGLLELDVGNIRLVGSSVTVPLPTSPEMLTLPFSNFQNASQGNTQPVNFADVGYIKVSLQLNPNEYLSINSITVTSTPEPTTAILFLTGCVFAALPKGRKIVDYCLRRAWLKCAR